VQSCEFVLVGTKADLREDPSTVRRTILACFSPTGPTKPPSWLINRLKNSESASKLWLHASELTI
jgi:hypothetical protein